MKEHLLITNTNNFRQESLISSKDSKKLIECEKINLEKFSTRDFDVDDYWRICENCLYWERMPNTEKVYGYCHQPEVSPNVAEPFAIILQHGTCDDWEHI